MKKYDVAAYVWPAYSKSEPIARLFWEEGIGEWQSVKNAVCKYPGHSWPRKPLWGYVDESDPFVMEMEIEAATRHGVNVFIYDWYWYDGRPFQEGCLNNGFLKAANHEKMKFYLMWANHDFNLTCDIRNSCHDTEPVVWTGRVDFDEFKIIADRIVRQYFILDCYYKIDGKPVFSIYDMENLVRGLGGYDNTRRAIAYLREAAAKAGLPGVHMQYIRWSDHRLNLSGVDGVHRIGSLELINNLGEFDSTTNYQFAHFAHIDREYSEIIPDVLAEWKKIDKISPLPYFPHVSIGWDNNPRFRNFRPGVVKGNTPEQFEIMLRHAKDYIDAHPDRAPLITLNSWNEWTETSYLEPDDLYGYGYLEAVRRVFGGR